MACGRVNIQSITVQYQCHCQHLLSVTSGFCQMRAWLSQAVISKHDHFAETCMYVRHFDAFDLDDAGI